MDRKGAVVRRMALLLAFVTFSAVALFSSAPAAAAQKSVVAYFVQWGIYARNYEPADIPAASLTHVNYAFLAVDEATGELESIDTYADMQKVFGAKNGLPAQTWDQAAANRAGNFGRLRDLKELYPHLKVLFSVGGWSLSAPFPAVAADPEKRQAFARSAAQWVSEQGFDGIDIDWEYPSLADRDAFTALMEATRQALDEQGVQDGRTYLLSAAGPADPAKVAAWDLARLARILDWLNIMTYDYHGGWDAGTGHQAPLYENPDDPWPDSATWNVDHAVSTYVAGGMPAAMLNVGSPMYGRSWETVPATDNGLFQPGQAGPNTGASGNWENGVLDYWKVLEIAAGDGYSVLFDNAAKVPWVYGPNVSSGLSSGGLFVTFESPRSLAGKLDYIQDKGLGGIMFWELSGDVRDVSDADSLLGLASHTFGAAGAPQGPWLWLLLGP